MTALKTYMRIAAEERAWAWHLSMDRAETDYRNGIILAKQVAREEGLKEGREEGLKDGRVTMCAELIQSGLLSVKDAAMKLGMPEEELKKHL